MNKLRSMTEITSAINKCLKNVANNYIEVGYYLALARDEIRLHPHTYNNETIWDYAERNFERG